MYTSFYGMNTNPFLKNEGFKYPYASNDFKEATSRYNFLLETKGIGLFFGTSGLGKTYSIRYFINNLNKDLYKVIYINPTINMKVFDFFKALCDELNIDIGNCYRADIYKNIQKEIIRITKQDKMNLIVVIDDAHLLSREILFNFKVLYDFEIDSRDYVTLIMIGHPEFKSELSKNVHETLKQRIIVNYSFDGLSRIEVKEYVKTRLELANTNKEIFDENALSSLYSCCKSSPRRLNTLVVNSLILGFQNNKSIIDEEIIIHAKEEMDLK